MAHNKLKAGFGNTAQIWNGHGLYSSELSSEFSTMRSFLLKYPNEFIIIDLNGGWYDMNAATFNALKRDLNLK